MHPSKQFARLHPTQRRALRWWLHPTEGSALKRDPVGQDAHLRSLSELRQGSRHVYSSVESSRIVCGHLTCCSQSVQLHCTANLSWLLRGPGLLAKSHQAEFLLASRADGRAVLNAGPTHLPCNAPSRREAVPSDHSHLDPGKLALTNGLRYLLAPTVKANICQEASVFDALSVETSSRVCASTSIIGRQSRILLSKAVHAALARVPAHSKSTRSVLIRLRADNVFHLPRGVPDPNHGD